MIPITTVIALLATLVLLTKQYFKINKIFEPVIILIFFLSWFVVLFDNFYFTCISYGISGLFIFCSLFLTIYHYLYKDKEIINMINLSKDKFQDVHKGRLGVIRHELEDGKYLATILIDGKLNEIYLYSDEELKVNDKIEVLGLKNGKFYCKKVLTDN